MACIGGSLAEIGFYYRGATTADGDSYFTVLEVIKSAHESWGSFNYPAARVLSDS